jgi:hypothetical protein
MRLVGQTLRVIGLVICGLAVLIYSGQLLLVVFALATAGGGTDTTIAAGRLLGVLLADLVFLAIFTRLWRGLCKPSS